MHTFLKQTIALTLIATLFIDTPIILEAATAPADTTPTPVLTPKHVKINRTAPDSSKLPSKLSFSEQPTNQEIFQKSPFEEPLVPSTTTTPTDNKALAAALLTFSQRTTRDDYSSLEGYLAANPQSPWRVSLMTNLGWLYRQTGWYSKAMTTWATAYQEGSSSKDTQLKTVTDRALAELTIMDGRTGRMEDLKKSIAIADTRNMTGASREKIESAKQALTQMETNPGNSFRCGPLAVERLRNIADGNNHQLVKSKTLDSTRRGTSMAQLKALATKLGMNYQVAKRSAGADVVFPAVVNWNVGHFAAIVAKNNNLYQLSDPTFGRDVWVSQAALDAEASGYFLVPAGPLPTGWTTISDQKAATVWGKGLATTSDNTATGGINKQIGGAATFCHVGMANYSFFEMLASLSIQDTPLFYTPPVGPAVEFTITYSQREAYQPTTFNYSNLSQDWTFNWLSYITDDPLNPGATVSQYLSGGGTMVCSGYNATTHAYAADPQTGAVLKLTSSSSYEMDYADGSKATFSAANTASPRKIFMTSATDPQGNSLTFTYDGNFRMTAVTDAIGQITTITYGSTSSSSPAFYQIATVTDPFGRTTTLAYTNTSPTQNVLTSSTDVIGITSTYGYATNGTISSLTTPYGTTNFNTGQDSSKRWIQATDPQGGIERIESWQAGNSALPLDATYCPSNVVNTEFNVCDSFFWSKKASLSGTTNYSNTEITHWLREDDDSTMSGQVEATKEALEQWVFYTYPGQPIAIGETGTSGFPSVIQRYVGSNGSSLQVTNLTHNSIGQLTQRVDPLGRTTNYNFDTNQIDLLSITQTNGAGTDTLSSATYNSQHEPLTTTDASGEVTTYTYYSNGQVNTITNAKSEVTTAAYNSSKYLTSITKNGATVSYTYDGYGRIRTVTGVDGYVTTYDYDNLNRVTQITYPDSTTTQNIYDKLDVKMTKDRVGRWTRNFYNVMGQLTASVFGGKVTNYERCICGALTGLVDPAGNRTTWAQDIEGRQTSKTYADGTATTYTYEANTSRPKTITDALSQVETINYNIDDSISSMTWSGSVTPTVSYTYDSVYPRLTGMSDATGSTTYTYNTITGTPTLGAGRLGSETTPLDTISYSYDELGRQTGQSIGSTASSLTYDNLGRITGTTNALGAFTYAYDGVTDHLLTLTYPNAQTANYTYGTATQDFHLSEIKNLNASNAIISKFDYTYDTIGKIQTWQQQADAGSPTTWTYGYDPTDQLLSATQTYSSSTILTQLAYGYDLAGNRISSQNGSAITQAGFNNLNQRTSGAAGGPMVFSGSLNKPGTVTVNGNPALVDSSNNFRGSASLTTGTNSVPIVATNLNGYATTNTYTVVVPPGGPSTLTYDANGNQTSDGTNSFTWDAKNELLKVTYPSGATTNFIYDGLKRRASIIEKNSSGTVTSIKKFVWVGTNPYEERDATNTVTKRFFPQGEQIAGTNYFATTDQLGSTREFIANDGITISSRYDYDAWGNQTLISGSDLADFGYADYYHQQTSGLWLTRAGDGISNGRPYNGQDWITRDPSGEEGGINLYQYVQSDPVNNNDPLGLAQLLYWSPPSTGHLSDELYSHVAIKLNDETYISYWPNGEIDPYILIDYLPARTANYDLDKKGEQGRKPTVIQLNNLNESAMKKWWNSGKGHGNFTDFNNCSNIASQALRAGGVPIPIHLIYYPDQVKNDVQHYLTSPHYGPVTTKGSGRKGWGQIP